MDYTTLGRTGMRVSVAGLGCGGFSRLGLGTGGDEKGAISIVHHAAESGVNLFDTAAAYGTEQVLGKAIRTLRRDEIVICTKAPFSWSSGRADPAGLVASLDNSLRQLDTPHIDVYQLHGVPPSNYRHALEQLAPVLLTETAPHDLQHETLHRAAQDGVWDVVMVGFSMMHQNARERVFPVTREHKVGTLRPCASWRRRVRSRPRSPRATTRSGFSSTTAAPAASSTPATAMSATSR